MPNPDTKKIFAEVSALHAENLINAQRTAENAIIIGVKLQQAKEILPFGEFEKSVRAATKFSDQTRTRYMSLAAERLIEKRAIQLLQANSHHGKGSTLELLADPDLQQIPAEIKDKAREEVYSKDFKWTDLDVKPKELARGIEGKELTDLYRLYGIIRDKKPVGRQPGEKPKKLSLSEEVALRKEQALKDWADIDRGLFVYRDKFTILADDDVTAQIARLEQALKARKAWLKQPANRRDAKAIDSMFWLSSGEDPHKVHALCENCANPAVLAKCGACGRDYCITCTPADIHHCTRA